MRELRKDVEPTMESPKEELVDNIDEMKIEEVLMGLKGLKQEEVFSFLGKNNFTPAETEEWLKMMTSAGFGNYDQLTGVDSADIEQLQLNFDGNFDGFQGPNGHMPNASLIHKTTSLAKIADTKMKLRPDSVPTQKSIYQSVADGFCDWSARRERAEGNANAPIKLPSLDFRRTSAVWPKCPPAPVTYSLADGYLENLREEEIVSTPMNEVPQVIDTGNLNEEIGYPVNNTYVIQSPNTVEPAEVADKPKPIKLLIKRVENEEEVSTTNLETAANDNVRAKSKRIRNPCAKRKFIEISPPPKKKRCTKKAASAKQKEKAESSSIPKKKNEPTEEFEFPFSTTVHQDDDFVYPSLDMSDDEEGDVYSFSQRDDETWTPKIKMKINEVKTSRPTRRKTKSAVAKCLEAAAMKRADSASMNNSNRRKKCVKKHPVKKLPPASTLQKPTFIPSSTDTILSIDSDVTGDLIIDDSVTSSSREYTFDNLNPEYNVPSTSAMNSTSSSSYNSHNLLGSSDTSPESSPIKPKIAKKGRPCQKSRRAKNKTKLVLLKTCKLIQTPPATSSAASTPVSKRIKNDTVESPSSSSCADKKSPNSYVTKRGKPKKGMATAKQRLGKILKMHKMFF